MDNAFAVHMLNAEGKVKATAIAAYFDSLLTSLNSIVGTPENGSTREMAIVKTKLEEACFFTKKAMASQKVNQQ
jgi:hypothetical protein